MTILTNSNSRRCCFIRQHIERNYVRCGVPTECKDTAKVDLDKLPMCKALRSREKPKIRKRRKSKSDDTSGSTSSKCRDKSSKKCSRHSKKSHCSSKHSRERKHKKECRNRSKIRVEGDEFGSKKKARKHYKPRATPGPDEESRSGQSFALSDGSVSSKKRVTGSSKHNSHHRSKKNIGGLRKHKSHSKQKSKHCSLKEEFSGKHREGDSLEDASDLQAVTANDEQNAAADGKAEADADGGIKC